MLKLGKKRLAGVDAATRRARIHDKSIVKPADPDTGRAARECDAGVTSKTLPWRQLPVATSLLCNKTRDPDCRAAESPACAELHQPYSWRLAWACDFFLPPIQLPELAPRRLQTQHGDSFCSDGRCSRCDAEPAG